jgi:hypothetical protein
MALYPLADLSQAVQGKVVKNPQDRYSKIIVAMALTWRRKLMEELKKELLDQKGRLGHLRGYL